jgi:putative membrane protein
MRKFFDEDGKQRVRRAVEEIEGASGAEVVVAVRKRSWRYRQSHYLFGFAVALVVLSLLLFLPQEFPIVTWPLEIAASFAGGALLCSVAGPLERWLTGRRVMQAQVTRAAKEAFVDLGIAQTRAHSGLLIYVSLAERLASVVADVGIRSVLENEAYREAIAHIERGVARADFDAFVAGLDKLGAPLASAMPRAADDVNELPDEVAS